MDAVNLSGTWSKKTRPNNGLTKVAELINGNRTVRVPIVGWVEFHQYTEMATGKTLTVALPVVEACVAADGTDPDGRGKQTFDLVDELRKERGLGSIEDVPRHSGELAGQTEFEFDFGTPGGEGGSVDEPQRVGEVRLTGDGPHVVPPPSAEEIQAERAEAKAAKGKKPAADPFTPGGAA